MGSDLPIPEGARAVRAFGNPSEESLSDEYNPDPERSRAFVEELIKLALLEQDEIIESRSIRL